MDELFHRYTIVSTVMVSSGLITLYYRCTVDSCCKNRLDYFLCVIYSWSWQYISLRWLYFVQGYTRYRLTSLRGISTGQVSSSWDVVLIYSPESETRFQKESETRFQIPLEESDTRWQVWDNARQGQTSQYIPRWGNISHNYPSDQPIPG